MLPRRPKYVPAGREKELAEMLETAVHGGVLLVEGACGSGKSSLALECAHRLPRALWVSCWPRLSQADLLHRLDEFDGCLFLDQVEALENAPELLNWCSRHFQGKALIATADVRLKLPSGSPVQRLTLSGKAHCDALPPESQLLSLALPRQRLPSADWLDWLEERFFVHEEEGWLKLHPGLARPASREAHQRALALLDGLPPTPRWTEEVFSHHLALDQWPEVLAHFAGQQNRLQQQGEFARILRLTQRLLTRDPRLALAHHAQAEARAAQGRLELALADFASVLLWGEPPLRLRALSARCHLLLDLGRPQEAEADAQAALQLAKELGGRQPAQIKACNGLGRIHNLRGQPAQGEGWARRALQLAQELKDSKGEAYAFFILGQSLADQELYQESLLHCQNALLLARQQGEIRLTLLARYWMAAALLRLERLSWAQELVLEAWPEAVQFADLKMLALAELMWAQVSLASGDRKAADDHLAEAEALVQRCGFPLLAVRGLLLKDALHCDGGWGERARQLADRVGLALGGSPTQEVWLEGQCRPLAPAALAALRASRDGFDLWIDLERSEAWERQAGKLPLLAKKIPLKLLLKLLRQPGQAHSAEALFPVAWEHPYEGESSAAQVRKNIATLRNLLEPDRQKPRYVLMREHSYSQAGGYYFSEEVRYCVIQPVR